jgi:adenine-specific DNA-methyltransferase
MPDRKLITGQKANGVHFTPHKLASFVAKRIIHSIPADFFAMRETIRVLDPACGDGELLLAFVEMLPAEYHKKIILVGVESDEQSLAVAKQRLANCGVERFELEKADFLEICKVHPIQPSLFDDFSMSPLLKEPADIIIANPPYVRTQVLGAKKAQELVALFGLSGRVDLYQAFLVAMTQQLASTGILGVITSNRFLSTKGGASSRKLLKNNYDIRELFDLGDTKLFDAAVLPAVLIGHKRLASPPDPSKLRSPFQPDSQASGGIFVKIYEHAKDDELNIANLKHCNSVYSLLEEAQGGDYIVSGQCFKVSTGGLSLPVSHEDPWSMVTAIEQSWLDQIHAHTKFRIHELIKVRVGIKTTADDVFIRTDWNMPSEETRPEESLLRVLVSQNDAERWYTKKNAQHLRRILYTHTVRNGKCVAIDLSEYPRAATYLECYRDKLSSRTYVLQAKRNWYEIWVPQNPELWSQPKIIFPDISPHPKFYYDDHGYLVDGNCYWMALDTKLDPDLLFLIIGIANSKLMTLYHDAVFNNKLYSGRRRYLTQYVGKYPLPDPELPISKQIVMLVRELVFSSLTASELNNRERDLETLIAQAFGVEFPANL